MRARLHPDGERFDLVGRFARQEHPVSALPRLIDFYRGLRARKGGAYAVHYEETCAELEQLQREALIVGGGSS